ncbi:MAG: DUF333 domain-containing protein [Patescibacteria group bacterium]
MSYKIPLSIIASFGLLVAVSGCSLVKKNETVPPLPAPFNEEQQVPMAPQENTQASSTETEKGLPASAGEPAQAGLPAQTGMANPASLYCLEHGGTLEITKDAEGGEQGICKFSDGTECDEWQFFRGECKPVELE